VLGDVLVVVDVDEAADDGFGHLTRRGFGSHGVAPKRRSFQWGGDAASGRTLRNVCQQFLYKGGGL
jgi:hypothetical protein